MRLEDGLKDADNYSLRGRMLIRDPEYQKIDSNDKSMYPVL